MSSKIRWLGAICVAGLSLMAVCYLYATKHPLVFNESFWTHAHCIKQAALSLRMYAKDHGGNFPFHTNGYADALLSVSNAWLPSFTGPGYGIAEFEWARQTGGNVDESKIGRVYVQGLRDTDSPEIALLFDKLPSPGDHCHFVRRIGAPLVREVALVDGSTEVIGERQWPEFVKRQIELLLNAGIARTNAERYYTETRF